MKERRQRLIAAGILLLGALCATTYFSLRHASTRAPSSSESLSGASSGHESDSAAAVAAIPPSAADPAASGNAATDTNDATTPNGAAGAARSGGADQPAAVRRASAKSRASDARVAANASTPAASASAAPPAPSASASAAAASSANRPNAEEAPLLIGQFANHVGSEFRLVGVTCMIDGQSVYSGPVAGAAEMFRRASTPGHHTVAVIADYQGNGGGLFSYWDGYHFKVRSSRAFSSNAEGPTRIAVSGVERGGPTTAFEDRLALQINVK